MQKTKEFGIIFYAHLALILISYSSSLYLDWKFIVVGAVLLQLYYAVRGGCDLTFMEFGEDKDTTFVWYYLRKIFPRLHQKRTKLVVRFLIPILVVVTAIVIQEGLGYVPLLH